MNNSNDSSFAANERPAILRPLPNSIPEIVQVCLLSGTILLAIAYTVLIIVQPTFRRNKHNWFTINICVTTVMLCITLLIMNAYTLLHSSSSLSCHLLGFFLFLGAAELMYSHCIAALSRLLAVVYTNKHFFRSNTFIWSCVGFGWLFAFLVCLPYLFVGNFMCSGDSQSTFISYYTLSTTLIIPALIVGICNTRIFLHVRQSTRQVHAGGGAGRTSHARDMRLLKIMLITFLVFFIGWTPLFLILTFDVINEIPAELNSFFQILPSVTMFHDVILIICANQPVRLFIKQLFVGRRRNGKKNTLAMVIPLKTKMIGQREPRLTVNVF